VGTLTEAGREARAEYLKNYRSGLTEEQKEARREYGREWRRKNPDKVRAARVRYWNRRGAEKPTDGGKEGGET